MIYIFIVCYSILSSFTECFQLHDHMTPEEVQETFQTTHNNVYGTVDFPLFKFHFGNVLKNRINSYLKCANGYFQTYYYLRINIFVPGYEIVPVGYIIPQGNTEQILLNTRVNNVDRNLYLNPVRGFFSGTKTKVWTVQRQWGNPEKINYELIEGAMDNITTFYQNIETLTSLSYSIDEQGRPKFEGIINGNTVLCPIPMRFRHRRDLFESNISSENDTNFTKAPYHIIYKRSPQQNTDLSYQNWNYVHIKEGMEKSNLGDPDYVYPEIMLFADNTIFSRFNNNVEKAVRYILSFWNGVDLRYRTLSNPKIYLNIAGIVLAKEELPFINSAALPGTANQMLLDDNIWHSFSRFMYNENKIKLNQDYDLAFLMMERTMISLFGEKTFGIAYVGGACGKKDDEAKISATAVIYDKDYSAIETATHELAHLLGAPHDGTLSPKFLGGPGAVECPFEDGYIMSYERVPENKLLFSSCSQKSMTYFLGRKNAECLRNNPAFYRNDKQLPRMLPGKLASLDEQCQDQGFIGAYNRDSTVCLTLKCYDAINIVNDEVFHKPAAEGSSCGIGMYCLQGQCVPEIANQYSPMCLY